MISRSAGGFETESGKMIQGTWIVKAFNLEIENSVVIFK